MNSDPQSPSTSKISILLVEDHVDTLRLLARLLKADGHVVHTADGYQAALDVARKQRIDLAVCDIVLWDGNGTDLLRDLLKLQSLKAVAITGFTLADEVAHYREAGFAAVLPKPLEISQLTSVISELTSHSAQRDGGASSDPAREETKPC